MSQAVIGLIGGLSWESSAEYYRLINQAARRRLGGAHSARCLMWSFDFGEIEALQHAGRWDAAEAQMIDAAQRLERGGATSSSSAATPCIAWPTSSPPRSPFRSCHIADPTASRIQADGHRRVGLLGTAFTMEHEFYRGRLQHRFGLDVIVPDTEDRSIVHRIIYEELVQGDVRAESRLAYRAIMAKLAAAGAEAIILGCTEIMLLVGQDDSPVPIYDTTALHAEAAVAHAIPDQPGWC